MAPGGSKTIENARITAAPGKMRAAGARAEPRARNLSLGIVGWAADRWNELTNLQGR